MQLSKTFFGAPGIALPIKHLELRNLSSPCTNQEEQLLSFVETGPLESCPKKRTQQGWEDGPTSFYGGKAPKKSRS